jgi:hypothetical protein
MKTAMLAAAAVVPLVALGAVLTTRGTAGHASPEARYGGLPSWLPKTRHLTNRVMHASASHPALAIQGNEVLVALPRGRVLATAVGPQVPEAGHFPVPSTSPCTFVVTFTGATGPVALSPAAFALIDDLGHVRHPRVTAMDGGPAPRSVASGQTVSLKLRDVIPTGDGGLTWAPNGGQPIVAWDFVVEVD